jgi:hypothetical protein
MQLQYDADRYNPLDADNPGAVPMMLDGMYDSQVGSILDDASMSSDKRKKRRQTFNEKIGGYVSAKSDALLQQFTPAFLVKTFGIEQKQITNVSISQTAWDVIQAKRNSKKDIIRYKQMHGYVQTKNYLHHIE